MNINQLSQDISVAKSKAINFVRSSFDGNVDFFFTPNSDASSFSRCFGIFCFNFFLIGHEYNNSKKKIVEAIINDLDNYRSLRLKKCENILLDKHYLQLLSFSLSALYLTSQNELKSLDIHYFTGPIDELKRAINYASSRPDVSTYGNINMAHAVILIWMTESGILQDSSMLDEWVITHIANMNKFGFWGNIDNPTYLQFQNGYHQYEIFDYLSLIIKKEVEAASMVAEMADPFGSFAPHPGGGGCYDYDAIHIITRLPSSKILPYRDLLFKAANSIIKNQNVDGGFCETHCLRPRNFKNLKKNLKHIISPMPDRKGRLVHFLRMLRSVNNQYNTHFTQYQRQWGESNLWDTWFRLKSLDRIQVKLDPNNKTACGHINFPGIGFERPVESK